MKKSIKGFILGVIITTMLMSTVFGAQVKKTIEVIYNSVNFTVNGTKINADNILYEGTTYVPIRAVADALGKDVGWNQETYTASINDKTPPVANIDKKSKLDYGLNEWWEVENQFSDKNPEAVVVIKYTYENLGYQGSSQDLYITPDNVIDGERKVAETYPAGANIYAKPTPFGAIMEGAEESYGLTSNKGNITIHFDKYDDSSTKHKAMFVITLPSN